MRFGSYLALIALVVVTGCAQQPKKLAFNKVGAQHIKTVVVTRSPNQETYEAAVLGHPGMSFGLVGGLIAAADIQAKSNRLTAAIDAAETRLQERTASLLSDAMAKAGYDTKIVPVTKRAGLDQAALEIVNSGVQTDSVLLVETVGSYLAAGPSTDYFPFVVVRVRSVDSKSGKTLYEDTLTYGYAMSNTQTVHFASDATYRFRSIEALTADPKKTRQGLYAGVEAIVAQIAQDMARD